jgi:rhomboid protease GluP
VAFVTPLLIAANVAVFAALGLAGVDVFRPSGQDLLPWGANFTPLTTGGEWWRLFTATFLHFGVAHLAFNMWALLSAGLLVERAYGRLPFAVLYVASGLVGSAASVLWRQDTVSAGASGAVFGVYGALLAWLVVQKRALPKPTLVQLLASTLIFVGYNVVTGLAASGIDNAAHLGGLAAGLVTGAILARPLAGPGRRAHSWPRLATGALVAGIALAVMLAFVPRTAEVYRQEQAFRAATREFIQEERALQAALRQLVEDRRANEFDDREMARRLAPLASRWAAAHTRMAALPASAGGAWEADRALLLRYTALRRDEWTALAQALGTQDREKLERFKTLRAEADATLKALNTRATTR